MHEEHEEIVHLTVSGTRLTGRLLRPAEACGLVLLAQEEPYGSASARTGHLARFVRQAGFATLACDLRGSDFADPDPVEDPVRLATRLAAWLEVALHRAGLAQLPLGLAAGGHAGAAALLVAMKRPEAVRALALVSGRPDLVLYSLPAVRCPTLLAVCEHDRAALRHGRIALRRLRCHRRLEVLSGLHRHAREANAVLRIAISIRRWMRRYLIPPADASCVELHPHLRVITPDAPRSGTALARRWVGLEALVAATRTCQARPLPPRADEE